MMGKVIIYMTETWKVEVTNVSSEDYAYFKKQLLKYPFAELAGKFFYNSSAIKSLSFEEYKL